MSVSILNQLESQFPNIAFALIGDSPFSSCCADEISAKHILASVILQFGHSCGSDSKVPVLHIPEPLDPDYDSLIKNIHSLPKNLHVLGQSLKNIENAKKILAEYNKDIVLEKTSAEALVYVGDG